MARFPITWNSYIRREPIVGSLMEYRVYFSAYGKVDINRYWYAGAELSDLDKVLSTSQFPLREYKHSQQWAILWINKSASTRYVVHRLSSKISR